MTEHGTLQTGLKADIPFDTPAELGRRIVDGKPG